MPSPVILRRDMKLANGPPDNADSENGLDRAAPAAVRHLKIKEQALPIAAQENIGVSAYSPTVRMPARRRICNDRASY